MTDARDVFISGLKDAYALEQQTRDMMESQANRLEDYPDLQARASEHLRETENQIDRLRQCLEMIGESPSTLKKLGARTMGAMQSMVHATVTDEHIKDTLTGYGVEHLEIASYRSLIAFANRLGEQRMVPLLKESLHEEEAMADWVGKHIESITQQFCAQAEMPAHQSRTV